MSFIYNHIISSPFNQEISGVQLIIPLLIVILVLSEIRIVTLRRRNRDLTDKKLVADEIIHQRNLLRMRNKNIEDSLKYAQRIQNAMFTTRKELTRIFPESFVFQRPKDIVSGDFFWTKQLNGKIFFSVVDCTGHGVPGAFMSLIGLEFFRQIIVERQIHKPSLILQELNSYFNKVFENLEDISLKDGMDLALCSYDNKSHLLEYAGAFNPIYIIRDNEIREIKGDRIIVGPDYGFERGTFTNQSVKLEEGDTLYLFSDGYPDQFGGPEGKKFKYRRFRHFLLSIHQLPMEEQRQKLEDQINDWMGGKHEQIDDLLVLGIRPVSCASS